MVVFAEPLPEPPWLDAEEGSGGSDLLSAISWAGSSKHRGGASNAVDRGLLPGDFAQGETPGTKALIASGGRAGDRTNNV